MTPEHEHRLDFLGAAESHTVRVEIHRCVDCEEIDVRSVWLHRHNGWVGAMARHWADVRVRALENAFGA